MYKYWVGTCKHKTIVKISIYSSYILQNTYLAVINFKLTLTTTVIFEEFCFGTNFYKEI